VRRSNVVGTNNDRPDFVARSLKLTAHPVESFRLERSDSERVLCHDPAGANVSHNAEELRPEPSQVSRSLPSPCHRRGLARRASGHNIDWSASTRNRIGCHLAHVAEVVDSRPVLSEHGAWERLDLAQPDRAEAASGLEAQVEPADAREERQHAQAHCCTSR
jgi:hypothetical protein